MREANRKMVLLRSILCAGIVCRALAASPAPFDADARAATIGATAAADAPYLVRLESRVFLPRGRADVATLPNEKVFVQFKRTLTFDEQAALEASGVAFHESFEPFAYLVSVPRDAAGILQSHPLFLGAEPIQPSDKVTASIFRNDIPAEARRPDGG